jgi:hypothetical protein
VQRQIACILILVKKKRAKFSATARADPVALDLSKPKGDLRL